MNWKNTTIFIGVVLLTLVRAPFAYGLTIPSFPLCESPQGTQKVSYSTGTHGIVGSTATYTGSDTVYTLSGDTLAQCFCPENGTGIQTNWWKATGLSDEDIQVLKNQGWYFVPNGSLWGLEDAPYVAQNIDYSCNATGGTEVSQVQSAFYEIPSILGLAATGNTALLIGNGVAGLAFLLLGLYLLRQTRK